MLKLSKIQGKVYKEVGDDMTTKKRQVNMTPVRIKNDIYQELEKLVEREGGTIQEKTNQILEQHLLGDKVNYLDLQLEDKIIKKIDSHLGALRKMWGSQGMDVSMILQGVLSLIVLDSKRNGIDINSEQVYEKLRPRAAKHFTSKIRNYPGEN